MEAIIEAVVGGLMNCLCSNNTSATRSVVQVCKHVISPTKEIQSLRNNFTKLIGRVDDVKRKLHSDEVIEGKTPTNDAKHWLEVVEKILTEMNVVEDQVKEAKTCLKGLLPDCCSRSKLGHRISELTREVVALYEKGGHFLDGTLPLSLPEVNKGTKLPMTRLVGKTAEKNIKKVCERLRDPNVGKIGIYGMGGAGKTTILKEVHNRLVEENQFDKVIWVTVSKDASVQQIQCHIAKELNLTLSDDDGELRRSASLLKTLKRNKKFVLVLDDMWENFPLHIIGIPEPTKEYGCKILLTSRSLEVCRRMGCHEENIIKMGLLSKEEAWELFMDRVGVDVTPDIIEIMKDVVDECAYLPLAIITVGEVMTGSNDISEWRVTLKQLKDSTYRVIDMEEKVFKCLMFSYERLVDEKIKSCFLYCALYPEDYWISTEELVDYWIVEGLIQEYNRQDEFDQGQVILNKLKHRCLLEIAHIDSCGVEFVKMHDLIREMALYITKERFLVKAGGMVKEIQSEEGWGEDLEKASFMNSKVTEIAITPKCPKLSTLFLNGNHTSTIPPDFFVHMKALKVLNLEWNFGMTTLPNSVSDLVNLRALSLSGCLWLEELPSFAKLTSLTTLKLYYTSAEELPHGMENLVNLRCLFLGENRLRGLPAGLIAKFCQLEELYLSRGDAQLVYEVGGERRFVEELLSLKHLESLHATFSCCSHLTSYVRAPGFRGLKMFSLHVGTPPPYRATYPYTRNTKEVVFYGICGNDIIIPQNTESLTLGKLKNLVCLDHLSTRCPELRECLIDKCEKLEYVLSFSQEEGDKDEVGHEGIVFSSLEELNIWNCSKLESLCKGIPPPGTLLYLKKLSIWECDNMKHVFFSSRLLQLLQNLECIEVCMCREMEELIPLEEEKDITSIPTISLPPKLEHLRFLKLPKLKSVWKRGMVCNSLQRLWINECDGLKKLPQLSASSLKQFYGSSQQWWDSLEWDDDNASLRSHLQPLFQVNQTSQEMGRKQDIHKIPPIMRHAQGK